MTKLGINISWYEKNIDEYTTYIKKCRDLNIKFIRIILSSWSLNALLDRNNITDLKYVLDICSKYNIDVQLSIMNFVDFKEQVYNDSHNKDYSWFNNKYYLIYGYSKKEFFNKFNEYLKEDIDNLFITLSEYNNVKKIEIMNELDQLELNDNVIIKWSNKIVDYLKIKYPNYKYSVSVSNHIKYEKYKEKIKCEVDLHMYSFPYDSMSLNMMSKKLSFIGEFAKYSDKPNTNSINSKIYFAAGIWLSNILKYDVTPLSWWWNSILNNKDYIDIIKNFNSKKFSINSNKFELIDIDIIRKKNDKNEISKIISRMAHLIIHPISIKNELISIKKFLWKKLHPNNKIIHFIDVDIYFIETYFDININDIYKANSIIYDVINNKIINNNIIKPGVYILGDSNDEIFNRL